MRKRKGTTTSRKAAADSGEIRVRGERIPVVYEQIAHRHLKYYSANPRVYSVVRTGNHEPTQEEIEEHLQDMEHVRELVQDIKRHGGLIDRLVVKDGTLEVLEGNSRLAAWRFLSDRDPNRWSEVECMVLPAATDESLISALLGQWHLKGKTRWPPYEQAGHLYRRHKVDGVVLKELAREVGFSVPKVKQSIDAYDFMVRNDDNQRDRWSYYYEYVRSRTISKARDKFDKLDGAVVKQIKAGKIDRAQDLRDFLPVVCRNDRVLRKFVRGELALTDAHEMAKDLGGDHASYQKLKKFRMWLADEDVREALGGTKAAVRDKVLFEVKQLRALVDKVFKGLKG